MRATLLCLAALTSLVAAGKCVTKKTGTLVTAPFSTNSLPKKSKPFAWNYLNQLAFFHNTPHEAIQVEWQTCSPAWWKGGQDYPISRWIPGRIYLPKTKECLGAKRQNPKDIYSPLIGFKGPCPNSAVGEEATAKSWYYNWLQSDYANLGVPGYYWYGDLVNGEYDPKSNLTNCVQGPFGYYPNADVTGGAGADYAEPTTSKPTEYRVAFQCGYVDDQGPDGSPFLIQ